MKSRRLISLFVSLSIVLCMTPSVAFAADDTADSNASDTVKPAVEKLAWTKTYKSFKAGKSKVFKVNKKGASFTSSKPSVATVGKTTGKVVGKRYGTTVITATVSREKVTYKLQIKPKKVIGIDPGHQTNANLGLEAVGPGSSTRKIKVAGGTQGVATGIPEYELTLQIGKKLKKKLVSRGYKVVMTRTKNNVNITNQQRAKKLNKKCDVAIRLHADAAGSSASGASMLYPSASNPYVGKLSAKSKKLSNKILNKYCKSTGIRKRGLMLRDDLTGTNWSTIPVTLIEMGFMTNSSEDRFMASKAGQKKMVKGIADGIDAYFGY